MNISVVVPSLNQGGYIEQCLTSIIGQDFSGEFELIVVDGCSTDSTIDILEAYKDRISTLIIEPDKGQADALRKGFAQASGDILCYLNSDDYYLPDAFRLACQFFEENPNVDVLYTDRLIVDESRCLIDCWILPPHSNYLMKRWDYIPQESCFWRRSIYEDSAGIDDGLSFAMDFDLFIQFMDLGTVVHLPLFNSVFRRHSESKTTLFNQSDGQREVADLWRTYDIQLHRRDRFIGSMLRRWIEWKSKRHLTSHFESLKRLAQ